MRKAVKNYFAGNYFGKITFAEMGGSPPPITQKSPTIFCKNVPKMAKIDVF